MFTLIDQVAFDEEVRKSRFRALALPVSDVGCAMAFFEAESDPLATHNCWAYRIGQSYRFHDDGEPSGTAGKPILQAIDTLRCDKVAVLVLRWFGGIKLGAGGLARAYGGAAAQCLRQGELMPIVVMREVGCACSFGDMARIRQKLDRAAAQVFAEHFSGDGVAWRLRIPESEVEALRLAVADISRGRAQWDAGAS